MSYASRINNIKFKFKLLMLTFKYFISLLFFKYSNLIKFRYYWFIISSKIWNLDDLVMLLNFWSLDILDYNHDSSFKDVSDLFY